MNVRRAESQGILLFRSNRAAMYTVICAAVLASTGTSSAYGQEAARQPLRDVASETRMKITEPFTVAAVGDIIEPQPLYSSDARFQDLIQKIKGADVGFANMESSLVDFRTFPGPVTGTEAPLEVGDAIKAIGITLMSRANNHALDGGVPGMFSTDETLDKLHIAHAGTGRNLQQARGAQFVETPKGRVGLVSMFSVDDASNFGPGYNRTEATYRNGNLGGAPGVDPVHVTTYHVVTPDQLQMLKGMAASLFPARSTSPATAQPTGSDRFKFFDEWFEAGPDPGTLHYDLNANDEKSILDSIRNGKVYADFMIASIHTHQTPSYTARTQSVSGAPDTLPIGQTKEGLDHMPADFLIKLAHDSVDNGADMFITHGVHALAGLEIYKGKPIFYGLSNFVFQFGLQFGSGYDILANEKGMSALENPASQQALLTTCRFEGGELKEVRLYPVDLGGTRRPISQIGIPMTPDPQTADRMLKELQDYSRPFGTRISVEEHVGVIRIGAPQ